MSVDEYREFARQQQLRFERMMRDHALRFERLITEWRAEWREERAQREADSIRRHEEIMSKLDEESRKTDEILAEGRAQRAALFQILDRLSGDGAEPAT